VAVCAAAVQWFAAGLARETADGLTSLVAHPGQMQLRAPANRTYSPRIGPPTSLGSRGSLWAFVYAAAIITLVFASVGVIATWSGAFGSPNASARASSLTVPAHGTSVVNPVRVLRVRDYELRVQSVPRRLGLATTAAVKLLKGGRAVDKARVRLTFTMPEMPSMRGLSTLLRETAPGVYAQTSPILTVGSWLATIQVSPPHATGFKASFTYRISA
jgi:hypothetical protein